MSEIPLISQALKHKRNIAIIDEAGNHTYEELLEASGRGASFLLGGQIDLKEARIAFMVPPGFGYVMVQWSIWRAGGIAVPLCLKHPLPEIEYVLDDTGAQVLVVHDDYWEMLEPAAASRNLNMIQLADLQKPEIASLPSIDVNRRAMILYTSGTTSRPKGVVTTHANITSQITCLVDAWGWQAGDEILHVLPLHHTHGIVNVLLCALWAGARCRVLPGFDAEQVWAAFLAHPLTLFMAVPTIYARLISFWDHAPASEKVQMTSACRKFRLMVSGSAALPVSVLAKWETVSGHRLLERYGMTEIGMALSNPLKEERRPGTVGHPLPGVRLRLVDESNTTIGEEGVSGEVQIQGPSVFLEYWGKPQATTDAFREDWFLTGDIALLEDGYYRLLGRNSVDIIKTGGYKVSALEIEEILRTHPSIKECAVIGIEDAEWGERVCAGIVLHSEADLEETALRSWAKERLAPYKVPSRVRILEDLPRNVMGKVTKPALMSIFT